MLEKILWGLGEIGDPQTISVLVPLLGEREAGKALRKLGQDDFVTPSTKFLTQGI